MPDIHIHRDHALGLTAAREVAQGWAEKAERKLDMSCRYEAGAEQDVLHFSRAGLEGTLQVTPQSFELQATLGFLFSAFKSSIEDKICEELDALIALQRQRPA